MKTLTAEQIASRDKMIKLLNEQQDSPERRQAVSDSEFIYGALKEQAALYEKKLLRRDLVIYGLLAVIVVMAWFIEAMWL